MRANGGDIKTAQERRLMSDQKRFKQKRDFKTRLGEQPEERDILGDRNFGKGKYVREDRRFGRKDGEQRAGKFARRNDEERDFKRGACFGRRDAEGKRDFKRGADFKKGGSDKRGADFKKGGFNKGNNKSFNKFRRDNED
jgi:putative N6-adenine-specific DNA methylase